MEQRPFRLEDGNENICGACLKSGTLICCENCPAAFHPQCAGYRDMESVPEGDWFCFLCSRKLGKLFKTGTSFEGEVGQEVMVMCDKHGEVFQKGVIMEMGETQMTVRRGARQESFALDDARLWRGTMEETSWTRTPENEYRPNSRAFEIDYQQIVNVDETPATEETTTVKTETYSEFLKRKKADPKEIHFVELLTHFGKVHVGVEGIQWPSFGYMVPLAELWDAVQDHGGFQSVSDKDDWKVIDAAVIPNRNWGNFGLILKQTYRTVLLDVEMNGGVETMETLYKYTPVPEKNEKHKNEDQLMDSGPRKRTKREKLRKKHTLPTADEWMSLVDNPTSADDVLGVSGKDGPQEWPKAFSASRAVQEYRSAIGIVSLTEASRNLRTGDKVDVRLYKDSSLGPWRAAKIQTLATASAIEGYRRFRVKFSKSKDPTQFPSLPEEWVTLLARPTAWGTTLPKPSVLVRAPVKPYFPPVKLSMSLSHRVGDRVEAWLQNGWWPASVLSIHDNQALLQGDVIPLGEGLKWVSPLSYIRTMPPNENEGFGMIKPLKMDEQIYPKEMEKKLNVTVDKTLDGHLILSFKRLDQTPSRK